MTRKLVIVVGALCVAVLVAVLLSETLETTPAMSESTRSVPSRAGREAAVPAAGRPHDAPVAAGSRVAIARKAVAERLARAGDLAGNLTAEQKAEHQREAFEDANRHYVEDVLVPRVRDCWSAVEGDGKIKFEHSFLVDTEGMAVPGSPSPDVPMVRIRDTTLSPEASQKALDCMKSAMEGTSFRYVPLHADNPRGYVTIFQTWPSPERLRKRQAMQ